MFDENNILAQACTMARDRFKDTTLTHLKLQLKSIRIRDDTQYNTLICNEIAAVIIGNNGIDGLSRDIIVKHKQQGLQRRTEIHLCLSYLYHITLFSYSEDGYKPMGMLFCSFHFFSECNSLLFVIII